MEPEPKPLQNNREYFFPKWFHTAACIDFNQHLTNLIDMSKSQRPAVFWNLIHDNSEQVNRPVEKNSIRCFSIKNVSEIRSWWWDRNYPELRFVGHRVSGVLHLLAETKVLLRVTYFWRFPFKRRKPKNHRSKINKQQNNTIVYNRPNLLEQEYDVASSKLKSVAWNRRKSMAHLEKKRWRPCSWKVSKYGYDFLHNCDVIRLRQVKK